MFQQFINYLNEDYLRRPDPEACERDGVRVISAGPNAFVYVRDSPEPLTAEALEQRLPGLAERLSRSPDIGFVLARGSDMVPIPGTKRRSYLEENLGAATLRLEPAAMARLDAALGPEAIAGPRYNEEMMAYIDR